MPALDDRGQCLCTTGGGIDDDISFLFARGVIFASRDAGGSKDGACFRL